MAVKLCLDLVPNNFRSQFRKAFRERHVFEMLLLIGNDETLSFVSMNDEQLKRKGIYEPMLLHAFTGCRVNNNHITITQLQEMFANADRDKLLAAGDPLPDGESFTIYRGVGGVECERKECSYSWTLDFNIACWYASRARLFRLEDPAVYTASVDRAEVMAFCNDRQENEVICLPVEICRMELLWSEIEKAGKARNSNE